MFDFCDPETQLGAWTFFAKSHAPGSSCSTNGLPLTLNSIKIYGRFQFLKSLNHPVLCQYLDVIRGHYERVIVISQYCGQTLETYRQNNAKIPIEFSVNFAYQILLGLQYLRSVGVVHGNLNPRNILILDQDGQNVKLFNFGLSYMTDNGESASFEIGRSKYTIPKELIADGLQNQFDYDVWSLGIILAEVTLSIRLWSNLTQWTKLVERIGQLLNSKCSIFEQIAYEHNCGDDFENLPVNLKNLIEDCFQIHKREYLHIDDLLNKDLFKKLRHLHNGPMTETRLRTLPLFTIHEFYNLWQLADGDILRDLKADDLIVSPNSTKSGLIVNDGIEEINERVAKISLDEFKKKFADINRLDFYPLIHSKLRIVIDRSKKFEKFPDFEVLLHRENNPIYQFHRIILFRRLLHGYPFNRQEIIKESYQDIPPLYRGQVWAAILNVRCVHEYVYETIDTVSETATDRQISVDVPRCHQYNDLMSSPDGHAKLKRILKAWVVYHDEYVYWQGLDSLTAPFLYLNFANEAKTFASVSKFIDKYLHKFFLKDNGDVIQEYLRKFMHLIAFHDPLLATHLYEINFVPELFAIPWFLTMFSHIFPLHKIMHLWDKLLLCDSSFPLHVGLALLDQIRDTLLTFDFNESILLFSDLPDFNIAECVQFSLQTYDLTPKSITERYHSTERDISQKKDFATISQLKSEICSRISIDDFLDFVNRFSLDNIKVILLHSSERSPAANFFDCLQVQISSIQNENFNLAEIFGQNGGNCLKNHNFELVVIAGIDDECGMKKKNAKLQTCAYSKYKTIYFMNTPLNSFKVNSIITILTK